MRRSSRSRAETTSRRPLGRKSIHIGNDGNWTWTMTSLLPSRSTAMTSWAPQSENHRRSSCHRGDSPNAMPVIKVCSPGAFCIVFFLSKMWLMDYSSIRVRPGGYRFSFCGNIICLQFANAVTLPFLNQGEEWERDCICKLQANYVPTEGKP